MILKRNRVVAYTAAAGAAYLAWRKLGVSTRGELRTRWSCALGVLLGNPVAYRVTVLKSGDGPGIAASGGPLVFSQCTVVGVAGNGFSMSWPESEPLLPDAGPGSGEDCEEENEAVIDETRQVPNVAPAVCEDGHTSYPGRFIRISGRSVYSASTPVQAGFCPECDAPRQILAGRYRAGADGMVTREELPPEEL